MIIIPARLKSSRLKHKALQDIGGLPMVIRVAKECQAKSTEAVMVATDSHGIADKCLAHNIPCMLTRKDHESGTDRIYEVAKILNLPDDEIIINVQGDYPFLKGDDLFKLYHTLYTHRGAITTLVKKKYGDGKTDRNIVKAVADKQGKALYFSRSPIPHPADLKFYSEHIGLYAMSMATLRRFCEAPISDLEKLENIEHLRALHEGIDIYLIKTDFDYLGVNTPEDLVKANIRCKGNR